MTDELHPTEDGATLLTHHIQVALLKSRIAELEAQVERARDVIKHYQEMSCEGIGECVGDFCGKLSDEDCAGCRAFTALAALDQPHD